MSVEVPNHILKSVRSGDKNAFGELIDCCSGYVYALAYKMVGNRDDAKDAAQESFIKVWENIHNYKSKYRFTTWLYRIVMNNCLDKLRKRRKENQLFESVENDGFEKSPTGSTSIDFEENQFVTFIRLISNKLSKKQQAVFVLHDLEEMNQAEVSVILGISKNSVKSNLHLARKIIRRMLISEENLNVISSDEM